MVAVISLKQGDKFVGIDVTVANSPIDLTTADSVNLLVFTNGTLLKTIGGSVLDASNVRFSFPNVDLVPGIYDAEIEVVQGGSRWSTTSFFIEVNPSPTG